MVNWSVYSQVRAFLVIVDVVVFENGKSSLLWGSFTDDHMSIKL